MVKRKPDRLDLRIAEIETKKIVEARHEIVQECLGRCRISHPDCPYLKSTNLCESIRDTLDEYIPRILEDISRDN